MGLHSPFLAVFCWFVLLFAFVLFFAWMRTAFLAGGNAVVRSRSPASLGDFAINGEGSCFCSTVTGLLGPNSTWSNKKKSHYNRIVVEL